MRHGGDRQHGGGDDPGCRLHIREEQQAAHADAGAPKGEQSIDDPGRDPGPERERGQDKHR